MPTPPPNPPPVPPVPPPPPPPPAAVAASSAAAPSAESASDTESTRRGWGFAQPLVSMSLRVIAVGVLLAMAAGLFMLSRDHPTDISFMPSCPSKRLANLECPGCGTTRGVHHLLNGRVGEAWRHNPAMVAFGLPLGGLLVIDMLSRVVRGRRIQLLMPAKAGWMIFFVLTGYTVMRNLPGERFSAWRPPPVATIGTPAPASATAPSSAKP
ncbi:MAG: DUF2752 domain-containing protein [Phycisphaerales bacterium]